MSFNLGLTSLYCHLIWVEKRCYCGSERFLFQVATIKCPRVKEKLAERILSEADCLKLIESAKNERDRALLCLMYGCGLRVSEVCALTWGDLQRHGEGGKCTVFGKGSKTRVVLVPASVWQLLMKLPRIIDAVFVSRTGRPLERTMVYNPHPSAPQMKYSGNR